MRQQYSRLVIRVLTGLSAGILALFFLSCLKSEEPQDIQDEPARSRSGSLYQACEAGQPEWKIRLDGGTAGEEDYVLSVSSRDSIHVGATFEQDDVAILIDSMDPGHVYGGFEVRESDTALITGRFTLTKVLETPVCGQPRLTCSDPLPPIRLDGEWAWSAEPTSQNENLHAVIWTGEKLVAVGASGVLRTSVDGRDWVDNMSGTSHHLRALACGQSRLIAVGDSGIILSSTDGATWTPEVSGIEHTLLDGIWIEPGEEQATGMFVAVGTGGAILTSSNGTDWTTRATGTGASLRAVAASRSRIVVVGDSGIILSSPHGTVWTASNSGTDYHMIMVMWTGSRFLAHSAIYLSSSGLGGATLESPDGNTWTSVTAPGFPRFVRARRFGDQWMGLSRIPVDMPTMEVVRYSADGGASWVSDTLPHLMGFQDLAWTGERLVVVGSNGGILTLP